MNRTTRSNFSIVLAGLFGGLASSLALTACHQRSTDPVIARDPRYLKNFDQPGAWFCRLSYTYSETTDGKPSVDKTLFLIETGPDGPSVKKQLFDDCSEADPAVRGACQSEIESDQGVNPDYLCVHSSEFITKYTEMAKAVGNWTCEMPYTYSVEVKPDPKPATSVDPKTRQSAGRFGAEILNPFPQASSVPNPPQPPAPSTPTSPTTVNVPRAGTLKVDATTSEGVVEKAFSFCQALTPDSARDACAEKIIALEMSCWNQNVGKNAEPVRKVARRRH
jgi:hypothetical protein